MPSTNPAFGRVGGLFSGPLDLWTFALKGTSAAGAS